MSLMLSISHGVERKTFPLDRDPLRIGRASQNAIQIADPTVPKEHAEIVRAGQRLAIRDLGSRNGTRVNGIEVHEPTPIREGDVIEIGKVLARIVSDASDAKTMFNQGPHLSSSLNLGAREILA